MYKGRFYPIDINFLCKYNNYMDNYLKKILASDIRGFELPRYDQLPYVGLYLEQTAQYINQCLQPLGFSETTGSMIRNYVKMGLVAKPVQKQYLADHVAHLISISILKHVLPLEQVHFLFSRQEEVYTVPVAYDYFCMEMENILRVRFGLKDTLEQIGVADTLEKEILRSAIVAVSHTVYLNACMRQLQNRE